MEQIIYGNIRVQLLSENILRIEYGKMVNSATKIRFSFQTERRLRAACLMRRRSE